MLQSRLKYSLSFFIAAETTKKEFSAVSKLLTEVDVCPDTEGVNFVK